MNGAATCDYLCAACKNIFSDGALDRLSKGSPNTEWKIHSTLSSIIRTELDGCRLCNLILSSDERLRKEHTAEGNLVSSTTESSWNWACTTRLALVSDEILSFCARLEIRIKHFSVGLTIVLSSRSVQNIIGRRTASPGSISPEKRLPTRLLDVSNPDHLRVIETDHLPASTIYLTLSHRWGSGHSMSLTTKTYDAFSKSTPLSLLPRTFRETIELTRLLGVHYLWIDSLCIIQDSQEDWLHESSMMGEVYAHDDYWLPRLISSSLWTNDDATPRDYIVYPDFDPAYPEVWKNLVEETPLGERGWVLQERILSPRVVHFAANQCFWECCQDTAGELFPKETFRHDGFLKKIVASVPPDHEAFPQNQAVLYTYWDAMVEKYSRCDLSFESDKLVAFAGLAQRACRQLNLGPSEYMAGLWRPTIAQGLLWRVARYDPRRRAVTGRGPSWSWISREGTVYTFSEEVRLWETEKCHIDILDHEMCHGGDPFGQVKGGRLVVRGSIFSDLSPFLKEGPRWGKDDEVDYPVSYFLLVLTHRTDHPMDGCSTVISGIVLVPTGAKRGQFRRVGAMLNHEIRDLEALVKNGKNHKLLDSSLYQEADSEKGFVIELV
ncbi:uncharacterized protein PAC_17644 [Phialocephala subalpina]|uniref:Heterokaryon incompatibility domain-containing protein n=1 Tax=Phialocephala subalpina TaxID=576137 RepID=A0A1L7XRX1_9HELO|nr:uncharacterized protein PAC_17644 [Phialocephala subalpina]